MASWLPEQVRLLGYSYPFCFALSELITTAREEEVSVHEIPCAFERQEGEEALYQFAERIQGLLDVADKDVPDIVPELEAAIRVTLTASRSLVDAEELNSGWRSGLRLRSPTIRRRR
jgi:hypothetical protein